MIRLFLTPKPDKGCGFRSKFEYPYIVCLQMWKVYLPLEILILSGSIPGTLILKNAEARSTKMVFIKNQLPKTFLPRLVTLTGTLTFLILLQP